MVLNKKLNQKDRGFTIVELLVVIVVIGILAAITIVSYTGVTARANKSKTVANVASVISVADAINADTDAKYPVTIAEFGTLASVARIPSGITIGVADPTSGNGTTVFHLYKLTATPTTGGKVVFYDFDKSALCNMSAGTTLAVNAGGDTCMYWGTANNATNFGTTGLTTF
ncbi:MAG: prepilin-type N-terminal cleavage/methylation domain-containing protein [Candidatus Saccharibacteria bacterium]